MTATAPKARAAPANETEERLIDAALTLFASQGYAATSVREIIEAVGVTRPVLYYYCQNKADLFKRVVEWTQQDAYTQLEALLTSPVGTIDRLRTILRGTFAFCAADPRIPALMFQASYGPRIPELADYLRGMAERRFQVIVQVVQEGLAAGELHGGDAESLALLFCSIMDHHVHLLAASPSPQALLSEARADALLDAFLHGVGAGRNKTCAIPPLTPT